jgi:hypothetical protein
MIDANGGWHDKKGSAATRGRGLRNLYRCGARQGGGASCQFSAELVKDQPQTRLYFLVRMNVSLRQNDAGAGFARAGAILPKGYITSTLLTKS